MLDKKTVAVFGLGSMGCGMAASVRKAGHLTYGFDTDAARVVQFHASDAPDLDAVAGDIDVAVVVVLNAAQVAAVLFGDAGVAPRMKPGAVVMVCATVPPDFARDMAGRCAACGLHYLDAPISGGAAKAASGDLSIMAAGDPAAFAAAQPVLDATAATVFSLGDDAGAGSAMKAVNQLLAGVHIAAMAEAVTFAMTQGISPDQFLQVIPQCAGTSWMLENRAPHIASGDYAPRSQVNIWPKDLGIVLDIAKGAGFNAPITTVALDQYKAAVDMGLGPQDDAAVAKVYARQAAITLPGEKE
ncbi:L-threonate dehydrogenase [Yoonia sp.]|uniref:L-threonate dehydrogenase n=1 Tax=Yoonia sp. TaxID=2212373 RepID=UPI003F6B39DC